MAKLTKKQLTIWVIIFGIVAVVAIKYLSDSKEEITTSSARFKGPQNASIHIKEFIDFQCPACAAGAKMLRKYQEDYPEKISLEMKFFPLRGHNHALLASHFAVCAGQQGQFWGFHDQVLDKQSQWARLISARPAFERIADDLKLDMSKLNSCVEDVKTKKIVSDDKEEGVSLKIKSTPTYFVNGTMVVGLRTLKEELDKVINEQKN